MISCSSTLPNTPRTLLQPSTGLLYVPYLFGTSGQLFFKPDGKNKITDCHWSRLPRCLEHRCAAFYNPWSFSDPRSTPLASYTACPPYSSRRQLKLSREMHRRMCVSNSHCLKMPEQNIKRMDPRPLLSPNLTLSRSLRMLCKPCRGATIGAVDVVFTSGSHS